MKTQHLRQDENCLNCGHPVPDRFCGHCGQENVETEESFGHLVTHFFQDITHYDSKFLTTLKFLFFYPGLLTREYIAGKRMSYVNPIRLYVFTSFVFFLIMGISAPQHDPYDRRQQSYFPRVMDSLATESHLLRDSLQRGLIAPEDTLASRNRADIFHIMGGGNTHANAAQRYDSVQQSLPPSQREPWWERKITMRTLEMQDKYGSNAGYALQDKLLHHYPKLMFLLLPFFALLLQWFFRKKRWLYVKHAIFSIHMHTFIFMIGILGILVDVTFHFNDVYSWLAIPVYLYFVFALRNAYGVTMGAAFWKSLGVLAAYLFGTLLVVMAFLLVIFAVL
ncbi:DUF3667 domain-containing protein [Chitinophaga sp.]|uniref:DUF3667 domain-containing protein n=1 Tax=Chitinophaga sp. TaxID=1869181 RepID=UPI0026017388|nr:DUF3667 domain-containing protein [uncultured Chitinophaga sp.]